MNRYIFITGGVVSSLGKGLTSAALGALLQARGYSVRLRKLDPYLNVDSGTMSPFEHGEVFVTDDGAETDLDIGHYERFTNVDARKSDSISAGRVYTTVLEKERRGDYLGKTIQIIPHVTDEIKRFLAFGANEVDFMLCEIGGTVGDIEGLPFFESIRQFAQNRPLGQCLFVHLTFVPYIAASHELKTKPTQHSVKELRAIGIVPNILVCRSERAISQEQCLKLALFCNVRPKNIITALDMSNIYKAPLHYHKAGLDSAVLDCFNIKPIPAPNLSIWHDVSHRLAKSKGKVKIAIVGKYNRLGDAYKSITEALIHGGISNQVLVEKIWIDAEIFENNKTTPNLVGLNAILIPGGFGKRGIKGKIIAANYARINNIPYFGICLGMQVAIIEIARNLAKIKDAGSDEFNSPYHNSSYTPIVYYMKKWRKDNHIEQRNGQDAKGGTMRLGAYDAILSKNSQVAKIYKQTIISERHRHRYEINIKYRQQLEQCGLIFSGMSPDGLLPEVVEYCHHPWYIGVQYHPELKSKPFTPHPLFKSFVKAAVKQSNLMCGKLF